MIPHGKNIKIFAANSNPKLAQDIAAQLRGKPLGDTLYLSRTTLRAEGDLFLCGMSPDELSEILGVKIEFIENDGAAFCEKILGIEY